jgi:uncharacterized membrane protein YhaH (DUF805 family)
MKLEFYYILSAISITIGCLIIYGTFLYPLGIIFIFLPNLFLWRTKLKHRKFSAIYFFECTTIALGLLIFIILIFQIPEERGLELLRKWYFIVPFWLLGLSGLIYRYLKDKEQAQNPCFERDACSAAATPVPLKHMLSRRGKLGVSCRVKVPVVGEMGSPIKP